MSNVYGQIQQMSPARGSDGSAAFLRCTRDGALYVADWFLALTLEGRAFACNSGIATTPVTLNATYATAEQDLFLHVPPSLAVIPVYLFTAAEDTGTAQVVDLFAVASATGDAAVTGTALTEMSMRMDAPIASGVTATGVVTAAGTETEAGNFVEFWRPVAGFAADDFNGSAAYTGIGYAHAWSAHNAVCPPVVAAGGSISLFASYQAGIGFNGAVWVELPTSAVV